MRVPWSARLSVALVSIHTAGAAGDLTDRGRGLLNTHRESMNGGRESWLSQKEMLA